MAESDERYGTGARVVWINHKDCACYRRPPGKIADFQMDRTEDPGTPPCRDLELLARVFSRRPISG